MSASSNIDMLLVLRAAGPSGTAPRLAPGDCFLPSGGYSLPSDGCFLPSDGRPFPSNGYFLAPDDGCFLPSDGHSLPSNGCFLAPDDRFLPSNGCFLAPDDRFLSSDGCFLAPDGRFFSTTPDWSLIGDGYFLPTTTPDRGCIGDDCFLATTPDRSHIGGARFLSATAAPARCQCFIWDSIFDRLLRFEIHRASYESLCVNRTTHRDHLQHVVQKSFIFLKKNEHISERNENAARRATYAYLLPPPNQPMWRPPQ
jgi:hypothetical protein